eukprot:29078_1
MRVNWHPNSMGSRFLSDIYSYWIMESAQDFLTKYKQQIKTFITLEKLNQFLDEKSGNWKEEILNSIQNQNLTQWVKPRYCSRRNINYTQSNADEYDDYCESLPFSLTMTGPFVYNTHHILKEYVYCSKTTVNEYLKNIEWEIQHEKLEIAIDRKMGTEGNMDHRYWLEPNKPFLMDEFAKFSNQSNALDTFHDYLIEKNLFLQIVVKTPKYGVGRIHAFIGQKLGEAGPCGGEQTRVMKVYIGELEHISKDSKQLGQLMNDKHCIMKGLKSNTKYVVSYVPYNITHSQFGTLEKKGKKK